MSRIRLQLYLPLIEKLVYFLVRVVGVKIFLFLDLTRKQTKTKVIIYVGNTVRTLKGHTSHETRINKGPPCSTPCSPLHSSLLAAFKTKVRVSFDRRYFCRAYDFDKFVPSDDYNVVSREHATNVATLFDPPERASRLVDGGALMTFGN